VLGGLGDSLQMLLHVQQQAAVARHGRHLENKNLT